jgi:subtilisin family serine protease
MLKKMPIILISMLLVFSTTLSDPQFVRWNNGHPFQPFETGKYVDNQIILKLSPQILDKKSQAKFFFLKYKYMIDHIEFQPKTGYYLAEIRPGADLLEVKKKMYKDPLVEDVSLNYIAFITTTTPNDPRLTFQYALQNTGQVYDPNQLLSGESGSDIKAFEGWDWTRGSEEVIIAIIDTGIALYHEDLLNKIVSGYNFVNDNFDVQDDNGHGTLVASIAAAETDNDIGVAGVGWFSKIMPLKAFDKNGEGTYQDIALAIRFAAEQGAKIINLSFGNVVDSFILKDACRFAYERGCVLVAATGNTASDVLYPAQYDDYCIAVGASDAFDNIALFSNFGPAVDVVAPGVDIFGAMYSPATPGDLKLYGWGSGTSYAAPHVAGAVALLIAYKPTLTNSQIMLLLKYTADDVNFSSYPGVDDYMGYGRLNLETLLGPYLLD